MTGEHLLRNEENWDDVSLINGHGVLMGYLSMAIKGLGYLVLTWTTDVLLGGFVSMLHKKDFWCLTFITLVQTAGVFDSVLNEKLSYIRDAITAWLFDGYGDLLGDTQSLGGTYSWFSYIARVLLACILTLVHVLVLLVVLCPLAVIYVLGIFMSGGISVWRLIEHDYSNSDTNGEASNLAPAMDTLYYLALIQGVLFCYRFILRQTRKRLANEVASTKYECDASDILVVSNYMSETRRGCEKDPSFAKGRNLIKVAVEKIGSNSLVECISGVRMLHTSINIVEKKLGCLRKENEKYSQDIRNGQRVSEKERCRLTEQHDILCEQRLVMNYLVLNASPSRHVLQKLLETLDSRGVYDIKTRNQAATIVERLAFNINLEEFPQGIQHISSLIRTLKEYSISEPYQQGYDQYGPLIPLLVFGDVAKLAIWEFQEDYKHMLLRGLTIIQRLATNENNCRVMSETQDLISKIMAPITSDLLHDTIDDHGVWSDVVHGSMEVMFQLTGASGESGAKLRREISSYQEAISTLWRILSCNECVEEHRQISLSILTRLYYMDAPESSRLADFVVPREDFVMMVVGVFTHDNRYSSDTRGHARRKLSWICSHGGISDVSTTVVQTGGSDVLDGLIKVLAHEENKKCRQAAADILEKLCTHYTKDDECHDKLKKAVTGVMPEVLGEIIRCADKKNTGKETDSDGLAKPKFDIENPCDGTNENVKQDKVGKGFQVVEQSADSTSLLLSLLDLCATVYGMMFDSDLPAQLDASSFLIKLQQVVLQ